MSQPGHTLYVGSLPKDIKQDELLQVFQTYGKVLNVKVVDENLGKRDPYAFVTYDSPVSAEDAIEVLHEKYQIREDSRVMKVDWAKKEKPEKFSDKERHKGSRNGQSAVLTGASRGSSGEDFQHRRGNATWQGEGSQSSRHAVLFACRLASNVEPSAVEDVFKKYGSVQQVHVISGYSRSGLSCAYIEYKRQDEARAAMNDLHDKFEFHKGDGPIVVKWAVKGRGSSSSRPRSGPY
eukprot:TRINITY_DN35832_c0_g1_i1.p1 TRINITY_DN35832_c0_g1~~TRINITY_DN35832_c0_g1_i1.p1  ORF type:complete len:236 (+),score=30.81 TRINITY_DN35832_c0_g1_i1:21-728(+)